MTSTTCCVTIITITLYGSFMARIGLEIDERDKKRLTEEAEKLGIKNVSALIRLLIKQFFANPTIDLQNIKQYNKEKE